VRDYRAPGPTPGNWEVQKSEAISRIGNTAAPGTLPRAGCDVVDGKGLRNFTEGESR
jgi:hypothetical protein